MYRIIGLNGNDETSNYEMNYQEILPSATGSKYNYYNYTNKTFTYSEDTFYEVKAIIDKEEEFKKVEINFTNPDEAISGLYARMDELKITNITECKSISTLNTGVLIIEKK